MTNAESGCVAAQLAEIVAILTPAARGSAEMNDNLPPARSLRDVILSEALVPDSAFAEMQAAGQRLGRELGAAVALAYARDVAAGLTWLAPTGDAEFERAQARLAQIDAGSAAVGASDTARAQFRLEVQTEIARRLQYFRAALEVSPDGSR